MSARRVLMGLPMTVLGVLAIFAGMPMCATCGGHGEVVTEAVRACPRAVELLGDDPSPARLGVACGSTQTSGGLGTASWHLPYSGSRARGTVSFDAEKRGGDWRLLTAELEVGGETIDLLTCSGRRASGPEGRLAQTNADAATADFDGKVTRSSHPTIPVGAVCRGTLRRERGATTARLVVSCGTAEEGKLYDGTGSFELHVGDASRRDDDRTEYEDKRVRAEDGTPGCRLSSAGASGTLTLWDAAQPPEPAYEIVVEL
ncbi:MAG TPA: cytochrome c oxidase assembly factor Coa1 family protein [Kofleriaceae bacterium]|nr:cytochrome c oxidase assembly factor Coa1 family protein [Kofleriaceae bacterium]